MKPKTWEDVSEQLKTILMGPANAIHPEIMSLIHDWVNELQARWELPKDIHGAPSQPENSV
jgi:hypothetical protein